MQDLGTIKKKISNSTANSNKLPFWQPKIVQGEGAITSEEERVQSTRFERLLLGDPVSL